MSRFTKERFNVSTILGLSIQSLLVYIKRPAMHSGKTKQGVNFFFFLSFCNVVVHLTGNINQQVGKRMLSIFYHVTP